jgi:diacylglycerol kinase family enzyme
MYSALRQLFGYPGVPVELSGSNGLGGRASHLMVIIANGRNFGGALRIAPNASITDGRLDAVAIRTVAPLKRLALFSAAARGTHLTHPDVRTGQAARFTLSFAAPPAYETDGEYNRAASSTLEVACVPGALRVVSPAHPSAHA